MGGVAVAKSLCSGERIVVAMSGGVDSALAAVLLHEQGYEVVGVSMQVWDYRRNGGSKRRATCCAPADFEDARSVAERLGFPYYVFDFEDSFYESVIQPFVDSYHAGRTPNPCLDCNRKVKFAQLRKRAEFLGSRIVATGHYAQTKITKNGFGLFTSRDMDKDQSYFLYALGSEELQHTLFPVGGMKKTEVREALRTRGLEVAEKDESQDICFVSSSVGEFVEREGKRGKKSGAFVDISGKKLGEHEGVHHFTVGQRRGLGLSGRNALYVLRIEPEEQKVIVGERNDLERKSFFVEDLRWVNSQYSATTRGLVKVRYRHSGVRCAVEQLSETRAQLTFLEEWSPVSPGQAAVIYREECDGDGDREVLGGGIISREAEQ